ETTDCLPPRELGRATAASNLAFWREQDSRCLGGNRHYRRLDFPGTRGHAVADIEPTDLMPLLTDPDGPFDRPGARLLKRSRSAAVLEMDLRVGGRLRPVIYKRFSVTHWSDPWAALVRPAPALRSYRLGHALRLRGLPTPRPLAVWHRLRAGLPG